MPRKNNTFSVVLDDELIIKLNKIAEVKGVARNKILVQLVSSYVEENWEQTQKAILAIEEAKKATALIG